MTPIYIIVAVFSLFFLPGLLVHIQSLRYLKKLGETDAVWQTLNPLSVLLIFFLALPVYSIGFYSILFKPADARVLGLKTALFQIRNEGDNLAVKESVVYGMASVFGINLDD